MGGEATCKTCEETDVWECERCHHYQCYECMNGDGVTGCQTTICICSDCWDFKCLTCSTPLNNTIGDYMYDTNPTPYCDNCKK